MKILILGDRIRYEAYMPDFVRTLNLEICWLPADTPPERLMVSAVDTEIILCDAITTLPGSLIRALPHLKLIHSDGVGYNGIDVEAARECGIPVCNCRSCNADAVAEITVMLMLMLTRLALPGRRAVLEGRQMQYKQAVMRSNIPEFADYSIGLIGLGDIAQATARRLAPFGNRICYYAPHRRSAEKEAELGAVYLPLNLLAESCDILSLHCPVTPQTVGMINRAFLSHIKKGAYLINTSRGQLIDNQAVREALLSGRLAGAAFDTLWPEPTPADHPLVALPAEIQDRVICLPHLGGNTGSSFRRGYTCMWENVRAVIQGKSPVHIINA